MQFTPVNEIPAIRKELEASFRKGVAQSLKWRRHQLYQLARMVQDHLDEWVQAIIADLGRPIAETYPSETGLIIERSIISATQLETWTAPEVLTEVVPDWQKSWKPTIYRAAKGVVLIIGPWNYPMVLTLQPLMGAIAAGCCAVVKPSELSPHYSALLAKLLPKYLDPSAYRVILGGPDVGAQAMEIRWDHIFFTGGGKVGRIIATAAGKHLTPVTLELGGKSPIIVDPNYDIKLAAKRILWGKISNCGQICVCPDHVFVVREKQEEFIAALKEYYHQFFPDGALASDSIGRIVNEAHFNRLKGLLARTKGNIVLGGQTDDKLRMEPTIIKDVTQEDSLMEEELFGPILPILPVDSMEDAISQIRSRPHPLMLYVFTDDPKLKKNVLANTLSGNIAFNDTFQALSVNELPLGGVGDSGCGYQILRHGFNTFSYLRSSIDMPRDAEASLEVRYPPYTKEKVAFLGTTSFMNIPDSHL
ncbi:Hexadecenal dehydrogenase [Pleurotus ostreatus]|nr:Hexadecenal dehydrogenase [Pleurotus ostreatus]